MTKLPSTINDIANIVGRNKALIIAGHYSSIRCKLTRRTRGGNVGGDKLYVPSTMTKDHQLSKLIGFYSAKKLSKYAGGLLLSISGCRRLYMEYRNDSIRNLYAQGLRIADIAVLLDLTERHIYNIVKEG